MIVLDTNVLSEVMRSEPEPRVLEWLRAVQEPLAITAVTAAELVAGVERLTDGQRKDRLRVVVNRALEGQDIFPFDASAAREYALVLAAREAAGRPIATADAQIAAICRARGVRCATRKAKDFVHTGIGLIDPWNAR